MSESVKIEKKHYENMPLQIFCFYLKTFSDKNESDIFIFLLKT